MLRTRLASVHDDSWRFDPPILSSGSIDLEVGRTMLGEYASSNGVMRFRTELIEIEESGHFSLAIPGRTHIYERRSEPRNSYAGYVSIEHCDSTCIDLSALGGRFETEYDAKKGERVRLDFPQITDPVFGWVLETYPKQIRVRFEERLPYLK